LGARLAEEIFRLEPGARILAAGGKELAASGATLVEDTSEFSAMGFAEVIRLLPKLDRLERRLRRLLDEVRPEVIVPIDYPGFNLRLARHAKERGFPVVYYVGPQVWAWGAHRVPQIARVVDRMLVVFPFEVEIYERAGVPASFVGHPILESLAKVPGRQEARRALGLDDSEKGPVLGLLAGSRIQEVRRIFPVMVRAARLLRERSRELRVLASAAGSIPRREYERVLADLRESGVELHGGEASTIMAASDTLLVTSGTATLEAALLGTPLAVLYRTSPLTWWIGRRLVKIPRISLVNIVAGEDLVSEFLQEAASPREIAAHIEGLLSSPERRREIGARLRQLRNRLGEGDASKRAAEIVLSSRRHA
jgi:lipid-A-disaccharide synthase